MGIFGRRAPLTVEERHDTAVHEAGHMTVAAELGATRLTGKVYDRPSSAGTRGHFKGLFDGSKNDEAVILLAGVAATRQFTGNTSGGRRDRKEAERLLRGSGMSVKDAQREAERLVAANRPTISRKAAKLAKKGRV